MKKTVWIWLCVLCLALTACGKKENEQAEEHKLSKSEIYMYYVNADLTDVVKKEYRINLKNRVTENADDIIKQYLKQKSTEQMQSPIPAGVEYLSSDFEQKHGRLIVNFNILYDEVQPDSLLFFKACIVKSLLQLQDVESVSIVLTDLINSDDEAATMTENFDADSFAMSFGNSNGYKQKGNIVLYFASSDGEVLKEYQKSIVISNNVSLPELVVDALIEGPEQSGYQATLSKDTTIRNISVKDGICYVDFNDEFYNTENPMRNDIIVYSVVNSLVELPTISKVQFLQNGEKKSFYRETMPFDGLFERNLDLIESEKSEGMEDNSSSEIKLEEDKEKTK